MEFLIEYGLFLAKVVTLCAAFALVLVLMLSARQQKRSGEKGQLLVKHVNEAFDQMTLSLNNAMLSEDAQKQAEKDEKRRQKAARKAEKAALKKGDQADDESETDSRRVFVLDFNGDIEASAVENLREEVSAVLSVAGADDEVIVRLESAGGVVHGYGLAASQLKRIRERGVKLTVAVDKVAASGGYMMACIADQIIAAPFAVLGSIGVVAQIPNFNRLLKSQNIDVEMHTAGEYKRTLTMLGENTEAGREKFLEELEDVHELFKTFVAENRSKVDIAAVGTGEAWYGQRALERQLVDLLMTSDEYVIKKLKENAVYEVKYEIQQGKFEQAMKKFSVLSARWPARKKILAQLDRF
ncbi:MAG: protease SohB [Pseudomonadales bacterium]